MTLLPFEPAHQLATQPLDSPWLVDGLWGDQAVGLIGGEPKCCKTFLALDLAVAVASGAPCLRRFPVCKPGRVLLFAAEDALHVVRLRLEGIAAASKTHLHDLDIQVITKPWLRLDEPQDAVALIDTVDQLRPRLLVLDPFVRLHRLDENSSNDVAKLLSLFRDLQREFGAAVCLVHHARKGGAHLRAGQALRGSSEFHAWADSILYLRRRHERLILSAEHRSAAGFEGLDLALSDDDGKLALGIVASPHGEPVDRLDTATPRDRVLRLIAEAHQPLGLAEIRDLSQLRKATVCQVLADLLAHGSIRKLGRSYFASQPLHHDPTGSGSLSL